MKTTTTAAASPTRSPVSLLKRAPFAPENHDNMDDLADSISKLKITGTTTTKDNYEKLSPNMNEVVGLDLDIIDKIVTNVREIANETLSESCLNAEALLKWNEGTYQAMIAGILTTLRQSTLSKHIIKTVQVEPLITDSFQNVRSNKISYGTKRLDVLIQLQNEVVLIFELKYIPLNYLAFKTNPHSFGVSMTYDSNHEQSKQALEKNQNKSYKDKQKEINKLEDTYLTFKVAPTIDEKLQVNGMLSLINAVAKASENNDVHAEWFDSLGHRGGNQQSNLREYIENAKKQAMGYALQLQESHPEKRIKTYVILGVWRKTMIFPCDDDNSTR